MSLLTAILSAIDVVGVILYLLASAALNMNFALSFAIFMMIASSAAINLMLTVALRSICQDLEYEYENTTTKLSELNKRIAELENKR
jgi:hypothetical protein